VLSVVGGKLTTYRVLAEQALEKLEPHLGSLAPTWTATAALPGGNITGGLFDALPPALGRLFPFLDEAECRRLARAYGTRAMRMLDGTKTRADLGQGFGGGLSQLEVDYLRREEWARSAEDILWRHTKAGLWAKPDDVQRLRAYVGR
jgi:glycerol-3-phosphate dehydrogenase